MPDEITLRELFHILWAKRWLIVATTTVFALISAGYAWTAKEWYRADVLMMSSDEKSMPALGGQFGGLAALAGISVGSSNSNESIATLRSREFAEEFINDLDLLIISFADEWNEKTKSWKKDDPSETPDTRDAIKYFHDKVIKVTEDRERGIVELSISWTDPEIAARWANDLAARLNSRLRERALIEATANVTYLQEQLGTTSKLTLQQSIGRLLENELQKLMVAKGKEEFAFRIIDPAQEPNEPEWPKPLLIVVLGILIGGMTSIVCVLVGYSLRRNY